MHNKLYQTVKNQDIFEPGQHYPNNKNLVGRVEHTCAGNSKSVYKLFVNRLSYKSYKHYNSWHSDTENEYIYNRDTYLQLKISVDDVSV